MKIAVLKERQEFEQRVAMTPATVKNFLNLGFEVYVESEAGINAGFSDQAYIAAGANVSKILLEILADADIIIKLQPSPLKYKRTTELAFIKPGAVVIGMFSNSENLDAVEEYAKKEATVFAIELTPRITRAQGMDVLSSQSNLAGYRAVIDACFEFQKIFPMMTTAAGTVTPAKVLVLGAGVAGLQAIATAKRLGGVVSAFDVRAAAKEQVESLGANFVQVPVDESEENMETQGGYAKEATEEYKKRQAELIHKTISESDIVISTALIPGKKAPILITKEMVESMKFGSVIVDLAASGGGNCELTKANEIINYNGIKILGYENYPSRIATDASSLYAKNMYNFIQLLYDKEKKSLNINLEDEIIKATLIIHDGKILQSHKI